ncbi:MAG: hypothetical protein ACHBNF_01270 [Chromatiales bacterium]
MTKSVTRLCQNAMLGAKESASRPHPAENRLSPPSHDRWRWFPGNHFDECARKSRPERVEENLSRRTESNRNSYPDTSLDLHSPPARHLMCQLKKTLLVRAHQMMQSVAGEDKIGFPFAGFQAFKKIGDEATLAVGG